jgi:hypothetical protein
MKLKVFSVYDEKAQTYAHPVYFPKAEIGRRAFGDLALDTTSQINKHPRDYGFYCMGEYDDSTGKFTNLPQPEYICRASDFIGDPEVKVKEETEE